MDKVYEAMERAEDIIIDCVDYFWNGDPHFLDSATESDQRLVVLAAEVRRLRAERDELRAMLEPTPDALELAMELRAKCYTHSNCGDYSGESSFDIEKAAQLIAAHDARLLDEAAERGVAWLIEQTSHIDPALAATNSGKWLIKLREKQTAELRAAIIGEEE